MSTYIALFRGINVGGHGILPMKDLIRILEKLGLKNVKTYIQSGNVVFQSEHSDRQKLSREISAAIGQGHGFTPQVLLLSLQEFKDAMAANPFPEAEQEPKSLHLYFLTSRPANPDLPKLESIKKANEQYRLIAAVFYLHVHDGIGRSKLAANVEKALGVSATARNWGTVNQVFALANKLK
jgi:uncharacterized protein (DUF1697 family)